MRIAPPFATTGKIAYWRRRLAIVIRTVPHEASMLADFILDELFPGRWKG